MVTETRPEVAKLQEKFGDAVLKSLDKRGELYVCIKTEVLADVIQFLKEEMAYGYYVECVGVDYLTWNLERDMEGRFEVVTNLYSTKTSDRIYIKVAVDDGRTVPTVKNVFIGAEYPEREIWDLLGVVFEGNEQTQRFLLPEDWVGHPLRKDVGLGGEDVVFDQGTKGPAVEDVQAPHAGESFDGSTGSEDVSGR